jgi:hypothetical protein
MKNKIINLESNTPVYPYSPTWKFSLFCDYLRDKNLIIDLKKYLLEEEKNIIQNYHVDISPGNFILNQMSSRYMMYNLFEYGKDIKCIIELKKYIKECFIQHTTMVEGKCAYTPYVACWYITLLPGESLPVHRHDNYEHSFLSGNLTIDCQDSFTEYYLPYDQGIHSIKNENGMLTIFPSFILHGTTPHSGKNKRVTIGFDFKPNIDDCPDEYKHRFILL